MWVADRHHEGDRVEGEKEQERAEVLRVEEDHHDEHQLTDEEADRHPPHHTRSGEADDEGRDLGLCYLCHQPLKPADMDWTSCAPPKMKAMPTMMEKHHAHGIRLVSAM